LRIAQGKFASTLRFQARNRYGLLISNPRFAVLRTMERDGKSNTVSFRIPSDLKEALTHEASDKQLSLNAFVISSLRASLESAKLYKQFPVMPITGKTLVALMQHLDEDALRTIVKECVLPQITEISRVVYGGTDFSMLMRISDLFLKKNFAWFTSIERSRANGNECFTARHGLGAKFSFFIGEIVKQYLGNMGLQVTYEATENFVILLIDLNHEVRQVTGFRHSA